MFKGPKIGCNLFLINVSEQTIIISMEVGGGGLHVWIRYIELLFQKALPRNTIIGKYLYTGWFKTLKISPKERTTFTKLTIKAEKIHVKYGFFLNLYSMSRTTRVGRKKMQDWNQTVVMILLPTAWQSCFFKKLNGTSRCIVWAQL